MYSSIFQEILLFFAQMLLSIKHVHAKMILHRDLKTQNILLDKKKRVVKIGDFGISKVLSSKSKAYTVCTCINKPRCEKTSLRGFRPGPTQAGLYSHRSLLEA